MGQPFSDGAFMSTSADKSVASKFGSNAQYVCEFTIKGKSGVLIENLSDAKAESEILFNKNTHFEIQKISVKEKGITGKMQITLVEIW